MNFRSRAALHAELSRRGVETAIAARWDCGPPLPGAEEGGAQFPQPRRFAGRFICLHANGNRGKVELSALAAD